MVSRLQLSVDAVGAGPALGLGGVNITSGLSHDAPEYMHLNTSNR